MTNTKAEDFSNHGIINLPPEGKWVRHGIYRTEQHFAWGRAYGKQTLENPHSVAQHLQNYADSAAPVYLDLETTGLLETKSYAFLVGLGLCEKTYFKVVQLFLVNPKWEENWIAQLETEIPDENYRLVTYNGTTFDLPLLRARYRLSNILPKWHAAAHLDLLRPARHFYKGELDSCSLSSIEKNVLGLKRSSEDIPGRKIPWLYSRFLLTKDALPLAGVFYHNTLDIVSLAVFQNYLCSVMRGKGTGSELLRAGDLLLMRGDRAGAVELWKLAADFEDSAAAAKMRLA